MKKWSYFLLVVSCTLMLFACSKASKNATTSNQCLRINICREPATLDPRKGGDVVSSTIQFLLFDGLTRLEGGHDVTLSQAESYKLSLDKKTYTFYLKDCYWSNGAPVTAYDYEYSWKKILHPSFPSLNAHLLFPIKNAMRCKKGFAPIDSVGVVAESQKKLVVTLEKPTPHFLDLVGFCVFFPVHKETDIKHPDWCYQFSEKFVCSGPFLPKKWRHHNEMVITKNPHFWNSEKVALSGVHMSMISNENTALQLYEKGELDLVSTSVSNLPTDSIEALKKRGSLHINQTAGSQFCTFNTLKKPFNNRHIRKAFSLAINRQQIVDNITLLGEQIATGAIPPVLKGGVRKHFFKDADIIKAQKQLKKGLKELDITKEELGNPTYLYAHSDINKKIAIALQQQWLNNLGIKVKLQSTEYKTLLDKLSTKQYELAGALWMAQYNDQMNIFERFTYKDNVKNYPSWEDLHYMQLLQKSSNEFEPEKRRQTLEAAEEYFIKEMPVAPIYHINYAYLIKPHVKDVAFTSLGFLHLEKLRLEKEKK